LKKNKIISIVFIAAFLLQLLPVKQAINYFCVDNITVEEMVHDAKNPVKPTTVVDEDHLMNEVHGMQHPFLFESVLSSLYTHMLPSSHADDVETPPPNAIAA
jgi:hypothetical protein